MSVKILPVFKTKSERISEDLREDIVSGELQPGEKLVPKKLAQKYGTSDVPVREALKLLESEGLVNIIPYTNAVVSPVSYSDLKENYLIRSCLEELSISLAIHEIKQEDLLKLKEYVHIMGEAIKQKDYKLYGKLNKEFHLFICRISKYKILYSIVSDLWNHSERFRYIFKFAPEHFPSSFNAHVELVQALEEKNVKVATSILKLHREEAFKVISEKVQEEEFTELSKS